MSPEDLRQMRSDWASYSKVVESIDKELDRRLAQPQTSAPPATEDFTKSEFPTAAQPEKVNEATMQQVVRPEPVSPVIVQEAPQEISAPQVVGGSQQAEALLDELTMREDQLSQTQAQSAGGGSASIVNAPSSVSNSNNNITNNTFTQGTTSSRDDTDMLYIYRATGGSR